MVAKISSELSAAMRPSGRPVFRRLDSSGGRQWPGLSGLDWTNDDPIVGGRGSGRAKSEGQSRTVQGKAVDARRAMSHRRLGRSICDLIMASQADAANVAVSPKCRYVKQLGVRIPFLISSCQAHKVRPSKSHWTSRNCMARKEIGIKRSSDGDGLEESQSPSRTETSKS